MKRKITNSYQIFNFKQISEGDLFSSNVNLVQNGYLLEMNGFVDRKFQLEQIFENRKFLVFLFKTGSPKTKSPHTKFD